MPSIGYCDRVERGAKGSEELEANNTLTEAGGHRTPESSSPPHEASRQQGFVHSRMRTKGYIHHADRRCVCFSLAVDRGKP